MGFGEKVCELFSPRSLDQRFPSIAHMERAAQRRTPKFAWDYTVGGIGNEDGLNRNLSDFNIVRFMPRYLADVNDPVLETEVLGQKLAAPFGPGPVGLSGLMWPEARQRWAGAAYATVERVGYGQIILFTSNPFFRGYFEGTGRLLTNAVILGPGMGTNQPVPW